MLLDLSRESTAIGNASQQQIEHHQAHKERQARFRAAELTPQLEAKAPTPRRPERTAPRWQWPFTHNAMLEACNIVDGLLEIEPPKMQAPTVEAIKRAVSEFYNISLIDLLSARRTAGIVRPRQIAMYLAKGLTLRSLPEIGRRFGGRDHTTVLHAVRKIEKYIEQDEKLAADVAEIMEKFSPILGARLTPAAAAVAADVCCAEPQACP